MVVDWYSILKITQLEEIKMELQEFINKGYKINAQVKVINTEEVHLDWLLDGTDIDECRGDTTDFWFDESDPQMISYDVIDPDGELISGYQPRLFSHDDVMEFIAKL